MEKIALFCIWLGALLFLVAAVVIGATRIRREHKGMPRTIWYYRVTQARGEITFEFIGDPPSMHVELLRRVPKANILTDIALNEFEGDDRRIVVFTIAP